MFCVSLSILTICDGKTIQRNKLIYMKRYNVLTNRLKYVEIFPLSLNSLSFSKKGY